MILTASFVSWGAITIPLQALPMILSVGLLYVGLLFNRGEVRLHRSYQTIGLSFFYTTMGYLAIFALLALFRFYYSRSFLLTSYPLTLIFLIGGILHARGSDPYYYVVKGGVAQGLIPYGHPSWDYAEQIKEQAEVAQYDGVVVDLHAHDDQTLFKQLADFTLHGVPVRHAASVFENYTGRTHLGYIAKEGFYSLALPPFYNVMKRVMEVGLILLCSPLIVPLVGLVALAIKLDSSGPVFFTQERVGRNGDTFRLYKFRSMTTAAEKEGAQFADEDDQRVTRLGKFIRKFRIDEIPQFWNVLKGDMSLIGPRPEQESFVRSFNEEIPFYSYRHKVRPGITGWAQIKDGYAADLESTERKLEFDLYYIKNFSFSLDLLIIYATLKTILTGFGSR
jgi:exopolysaccharide biosynthesis polyprenyl glycosylphosphotransferase